MVEFHFRDPTTGRIIPASIEIVEVRRNKGPEREQFRVLTWLDVYTVLRKCGPKDNIFKDIKECAWKPV